MRMSSVENMTLWAKNFYSQELKSQQYIGIIPKYVNRIWSPVTSVVTLKVCAIFITSIQNIVHK